jgi:O-antigen/teichoic acid export membrane protein
MPDPTLKNKTVKAMIWNSIDKFGSYLVSFIIGVILARILMPSDYGIIGMLSIFFALSELFVSSGFSQALIQKKDRTEVDFSTIFYFNIVIAIIFYLILFLLAPSISEFFKTPQLTILTRILSINIIINSLALVQQTRLTIKLDFKKQAIISLAAVIISGAAGLISAFKGLGVWALVIQSITSSIIRTILMFYLGGWSPARVFNYASFKSLFRFSSKLLGAGLIAKVFDNIYSLIIGRAFSANDLGYYTRAKQYPELLSSTLTSVLQGVSFPVLASLQDNQEHLMSVYTRLMRMIVFITIPSLALLALLAGPFIRLLLTEKWAPVIPLLQWLCLARMITPVSALNMNILNAIGRSDLFFKVDLLKIPLAVVALIITVPLGLKAIVIGNFVTTSVSFFINSYFPGKLFGFGALRQIKEMKKIVVATLVMSLFVYWIMIPLRTDFLKLLICVPCAIIAYLSISFMLKIDEARELKVILFPFFRKWNS